MNPYHHIVGLIVGLTMRKRQVTARLTQLLPRAINMRRRLAPAYLSRLRSPGGPQLQLMQLQAEVGTAIQWQVGQAR